ncbi:AraC family transcriptional regulator [Paenibacillus periandrae]|uniref:AraC family transcriptional regulator n=1 Tax=Paenibacillus periandrae TaxID=1761741 RepID=UPI001F0931D9|nr:AraC family transcriptional regulator [Paenibacillus periandrae]
MATTKTGDRGIVFWKNLGLVLLITCIPMIFIGVILYEVGTTRIGIEANRAHQAQLSQSIQQIDDYLSNLEKFTVRIAFDPGFDDSLARMDFIDQFQRTKDLMKSLNLMTESNPLIQSVAVYLKDANLIIGDESGMVYVQSEEDRKLLLSLLDKEEIIYWNYGLKKLNKPGSSHKAVVVRLPGGQMHSSFGAFLIYLDQARLDDLAQKLVSGEGNGVSFLLDETGHYLTSPAQIEASSSADQKLAQQIRSRIIQEKLGEHTFILEADHRQYSVSYGKIAKLGGRWTVVSATPLSQITVPVTSMSRFILTISGIGLLIGLLLSWFASQRLYAPISRLKRMFEAGRRDKPGDAESGIRNDEIDYIERQWSQHLQEQQALAARLDEAIPALRESFVLQFIQGHLYTHTEKEITAKMRKLQWNIEHKRFAFLVAHLHGMAELGDKYSERDDQLLTFAASNILLELCTESIPMVQVINFQDLTVGAFLVLDRPRDLEETAQDERLNGLARDFTEALNNVLRMKATIVISKTTDKVTEAPQVLEQSRQALRFRDVRTSNQLLDMSDFIHKSSGQTRFPTDLERAIVQAIGMGLGDEAVRLVREFMLALQSGDSTEWMVHQGMMKLLGSIHDAMIKYNINPYTLYEDGHLYDQLMALSEPDEMINWFEHKLIKPFIKELSIAYDADLRGTIEDLLKRIETEYLTDVSLEHYADELQMSPSKLSKAFKQITGVNFIDYNIRLRLDKCKELLCSTDMKINEIAELLRYQPSYLIRIFKKSEGMTPGQYREKHTVHPFES